MRASGKAASGGRFLTIKDVPVAGRRALVRVDYNVPLDGDRIVDATRIRASLPTINYLIEGGAAVILMSHLGRPKGRRDPRMSLRPVAATLAVLLDRPVRFVADALGAEAAAATAALQPGEVALLENVRFYPGDEANDSEMAAALAKHGDLYVNDAFGAAHRAHASTCGVADHLPAVGGLLMERELDVLGGLLASPQRPFVVVLGGAKVVDKLGVVSALIERCDVLALGGGMANTFLAAQSCELGRSLVERSLVERAAALLTAAQRRGVAVLLPQDLVLAGQARTGVPTLVAGSDDVPADLAAYDIGPATMVAVADAIATAATVFWNGTMGVYEVPEFARGTAAIARAIAAATRRGAVTVAAGGDSLAAVAAAGLEEGFSHLSTGGGAALELLEGKVLPGVACLDTGPAGRP